MRRLIAVLLPISCALAAACTNASPADSQAAGHGPAAARRTAAGATAFVTWPAYHGSSTRAGHTGHPVGSPLRPAWTRRLGAAVYGEPLVVGSTLVVATEKDQVYGLDASTGRTRWHTSLGTAQPQSGLPCGDIDPLGVTGTPAYDASTGSVFAVAETVGGHHTLWALDVRTGQKRWHRGLDVLRDRNRKAEQQRAAVLVEHGRVVVSFGGLAGDCDNYVGYLTSTSVHGTGPTYHYAVPTAREAGMWATPGPVLGRNGDVYVSSGNGAETGGRWDKSDSVTELRPVSLRRVSVFSPKSWKRDNAADLDLGSMSPMSVPAARRIVIAGKRGTVYLLHEHFGGVGSAISSLGGCHAFGGGARVGSTVLMPCLGDGEVRALHVGSSRMRWGWTASVHGAPVIAGTRVYVADTGSGDLVVLRLSTGQVVQRIHAGDLSALHFPSEVVDGGHVFVPTGTGVTAFVG